VPEPGALLLIRLVLDADFRLRRRAHRYWMG